MIKTTQTTQEDIVEMVRNMRESDKAELKASHGLDPYYALVHSIRQSIVSYTVRVDGELLVIFGVVPLTLHQGVSPWMLATDAIEKHGVVIYRETHKHVQAMIDRYGYLLNYVHSENIKSIRWLKWLGFTIHNPEEYGVCGELFHKFEMRGW